MTSYAGTRYAGDTGVPTTIGAPEPNKATVHMLTATVDFGLGTNDARTTITGVAWALNNPRPFAVVVGRSTDTQGVDDEDALRGEIKAIVTNVVDGVSFDIKAFSPNKTAGIYTVAVIGVGT